MMGVNPPCSHFTFHPAFLARRSRSATRQGKDEQRVVMDRDADRHGEQDWGGNWRGEAKRRGRRRAAGNKKPHATKRCGERITAGTLAYLHLSANFFVFWPPRHLMGCRSLCASQGCSGGAVYQTGQLISFWRGPIVARPLSGLIPISLPLRTLVCPSRHNDLCHSRLRRTVTWLHFETQVVFLWLSNRLGKWSWLWGKKGTGCPCKEIQTSRVWILNIADFVFGAN